MQGIDPGMIAQNMITYFGGQAGGLLVLAAILITGLLAAIGAVGKHHVLHAFYYGAFAWCAAFAVRTWIAWA